MSSLEHESTSLSVHEAQIEDIFNGVGRSKAESCLTAKFRAVAQTGPRLDIVLISYSLVWLGEMLVPRTRIVALQHGLNRTYY